METNHEHEALDSGLRSGRHTPTMRRLAATVAIAALLGVLFAVGAPTIATVGGEDEPAGPTVEASSDTDRVSSRLTTPPAQASFHRDGGGRPDRVADFVGGIAARVHSGDGTPIPGDLFLLMALVGSAADARLYDHTPYTLERNRSHPDTIESNQQAARIIEDVTGTEVQMDNFTSAPGGGSSAGITYAIAYLNIISDGAFTGDLVVAATGRLGPQGYVDLVDAIDEKTAAAHLAGADVLFTPTIPDANFIEGRGARVVGELFRSRNTGSTLTEERQWNHYDQWGMDRPNNDMDVVGIRHIGDVAAYLCGAGSDFACEFTHLLENVVNDTSPTPETSTDNTNPQRNIRR